MITTYKVTLLSAALAAFLLPAGAQTSNPPATATAPGVTTSPAVAPGLDTHKTIQQRKENQQDRIANGIDNGSLSAHESSTLEKKESELNQEERDMKAMDNGHLTQADRATLQQQQNQLSNQIYKDKHNNIEQNTHPTTEFGKRRENQQDRIAQGVGSGQLTAGEASNLEKQESSINREVHNDRMANGGKLTSAERAQVNRQQSHVSKQIYKDKHNNKHQ